jgi:hypothetical protein
VSWGGQEGGGTLGGQEGRGRMQRRREGLEDLEANSGDTTLSVTVMRESTFKASSVVGAPQGGGGSVEGREEMERRRVGECFLDGEGYVRT